jgi:hypothetical protein
MHECFRECHRMVLGDLTEIHIVPLQFHSVSRSGDIHNDQSYRKRQRGDDLKIEKGLPSDAANLLCAPSPCDTRNDTSEDKRRNNDFDQIEEDRPEKRGLFRKFGCQPAEKDSDHESEQDLFGQ